MKYLVGVVRIFVGILFIISGFIKLNDPVGFSFKLEEYFSQGVLDLPFLTPFALAISILVVIVEVMVGVMLILGYKRKITVWTLLAMIIFFCGIEQVEIAYIIKIKILSKRHINGMPVTILINKLCPAMMAIV